MQQAPKADWLRRFATQVLKLRPSTFPLDAMRQALFVQSESGDLTPEDAAEQYLTAPGRLATHAVMRGGAEAPRPAHRM